MFYENYLRLCNERSISPSAAAIDMGLTKAANTKWAAGKTPRDATLRKIADYFGVSVEYLMGETDDRGQKNSPGQVTEAEKQKQIASTLSDKVEAIMKVYDMLTPENKERFSDSLSEILSALIKEQLQG